MKNLYSILALGLSLFVLVSCKTTHRSTSGKLVTTMSIGQPAKAGDPVMVTFSVYNPSSKELKFCKWDTPFEGFRNSIFDIRNSQGEEVRYKGVMVRRVMPPPADAYMAVAAGKTVNGSIDLLEGYDLKEAGKYTIVYQSGGISGLEKVNDGSFTIR